MISLRADRRDVAAGARAMVPWLAAAVIAVLRTGSPQAATLAGMPVPGRDRAATELNYIRTIYGRTP